MQTPRSTGSYYTCSNIADYLVSWAIRNTNDTILEPSFGDGAFIDAAITRYNSLQNGHPSIYAVELQESAFDKYKKNFGQYIHGYCQDFMLFSEAIKVTSVIGNPPYVRFRNLSPDDRNSALECMANHNIEMLTSGSLWMPFVIHSAGFLQHGGRIAFVLPFELTYVKYAYPLWDFLSHNFSNMSVIRIHEDIFPNVDVETILFLAEGFGGSTDIVESYIYESKQQLFDGKYTVHSRINIKDISYAKKPFVSSLLDDKQQVLLHSLREQGIIAPAIKRCKFKIGYVCADKDFFHPLPEVVEKFGLSEKSLISCISNSKEVNGGTDVGAIVNKNQCASKLFFPKALSSADKAYIKAGEGAEVNLRYKCRQRNPWYITPSVEIPEIILTVFGDVPKLLVNNGGYAVSNSLLAGTILDNTSPKALACMWYNSLTLLSIELNVHSLGGGVLVLIPGETDRLEIINSIPSDLSDEIFDAIDECVKKEGLQKAFDLGDKLVLRDIFKFSQEDLNTIKKAINTLRYWRKPIHRRIKK